MTLLHIYRAFKRANFSSSWARDHFLHFRALKQARSIRRQLKSQLRSRNLTATSCWTDATGYDAPKILSALCQGFYINAARKHPSSDVFYAVGFARAAHNLALYVHPSSTFFASKTRGVDTLDWVVFHELTYTSRAFMRSVSAVSGVWLDALLPRIRALDEVALSGGSALKADSEEGQKGEGEEKEEEKEEERRKRQVEEEESRKRAREEKANEARERFLARKMQKK